MRSVCNDPRPSHHPTFIRGNADYQLIIHSDPNFAKPFYYIRKRLYEPTARFATGALLGFDRRCDAAKFLAQCAVARFHFVVVDAQIGFEL